MWYVCYTLSHSKILQNFWHKLVNETTIMGERLNFFFLLKLTILSVKLSLNFRTAEWYLSRVCRKTTISTSALKINMGSLQNTFILCTLLVNLPNVWVLLTDNFRFVSQSFLVKKIRGIRRVGSLTCLHSFPPAIVTKTKIKEWVADQQIKRGWEVRGKTRKKKRMGGKKKPKETKEWEGKTRNKRVGEQNKKQKSGRTKQETKEWEDKTRNQRVGGQNKKQKSGRTKQETKEWEDKTRNKRVGGQNKKQKSGRTKQETKEWEDKTRNQRVGGQNKKQKSGRTKQETKEWEVKQEIKEWGVKQEIKTERERRSLEWDMKWETERIYKKWDREADDKKGVGEREREEEVENKCLEVGG